MAAMHPQLGFTLIHPAERKRFAVSAGDETLLVLSGEFEMEVEGEKRVLGPGDSVFIPRGSHHRFSNVGAQTGEAVFVLSPPEY